MYIAGEEYRMDGWWSRSYCARAARSFNLMPRPYKALDLSEMLIPASMTWSFCVLGSAFTHPRAMWFYGACLFFLWCPCAVRLLQLVKGEQALRKGVRPTSEVKHWNPKKQKDDLAATAILFGLVLVVFLTLILSAPKRSAYDFAMPCVFLGLLWKQVISNFRNRFLSASLTYAT